MLIYEKDNKLNINFENSVNESPDLQIGKSGDKTEVLIDGQPGGGSGGGVLICTQDDNGTLDKTVGQIQTAYYSGKPVIVDGAGLVVDVNIAPRRPSGYDATIQTARAIHLSGSYDAQGDTEEEILAVYPTYVSHA